jgi:tetraacyldisaccharide 4'-kinase
LTTPAWQQTLLHAWTRRGALAWLLWPLSLLYGLLIGLRRVLYRTRFFSSTRVAAPVLIVGNVVAGGAGKTPVVLALVAHLQARGVRVGVISRGYGRSRAGCLEVTADQPAQDVGDEPALIRRRTGVPVFVAEQRALAAQALLARYPDTQVIVSDDGLQHLALQRDLEIGVFDDRGIGNGFLLPAGPLREPWPRPLDLVLHTGAQPGLKGFCAQRRLADYAVTADGARIALADLARPGPEGEAPKPLLALAAIARPEVFFSMLRDQGLTLTDTLALPDHHDFSDGAGCEPAGYQLICTEKDAVKLWPRYPQALAVPLLAHLPEAFWAAFDARVDTLLATSRPR